MAVRLAGRGGFGLCTEDAARDPITSLGSPTAVHTREGGFRYVVFAKSFDERVGAPAAMQNRSRRSNICWNCSTYPNTEKKYSMQKA